MSAHQPRPIEVVAGNDIEWACTYLADDGTPLSLDGITILAQIRTEAGELLGTLTVTPSTEPGEVGQYLLTLPYTATAAWPAALHRTDIRYTAGTQRRNTSSHPVLVVRPVSHD